VVVVALFCSNADPFERVSEVNESVSNPIVRSWNKTYLLLSYIPSTLISWVFNFSKTKFCSIFA
jgi:hypothetical protein